MKVYTKTGDDGTCSLVGGSRAKKCSLRLEAYGTIDEVNAYMGLIRAVVKDTVLINDIVEIQKMLMKIGGNLATPQDATLSQSLIVSASDVTNLELAIDRIDDTLPKLTSFTIPGGTIKASYCHIARTVCRRAERRIVELSLEETVDSNVKAYVNRLSDYLFVLSRYVAIEEGANELAWVP